MKSRKRQPHVPQLISTTTPYAAVTTPPDIEQLEITNAVGKTISSSKPMGEFATAAETALSYGIGVRFAEDNPGTYQSDKIIGKTTASYNQSQKTFSVSAPEPVTEWLVELANGIKFVTLESTAFIVKFTRAETVVAQKSTTKHPHYSVTVRPKALTYEAHATEAAQDNIKEAVQRVFAECGLIVTEIRRATSEVGAPICLYYIDFEITQGASPWTKLHLAAGAYTKAGNYIRIKFKQELLQYQRLCKDCLTPWESGCNCATNAPPDEMKRERQTKEAKANKKAAKFAALAAANK